MAAGNLYTACRDRGEYKSPGRMNPVWGKWAVLVKAQTFQPLFPPQGPFVEIRKTERYGTVSDSH